MLNKFNEIFNVEGPLKLVELENALIDKYGSIQYYKNKSLDSDDYWWEVGTKWEWEDNLISTNFMNKYLSREDALIGLFLIYALDEYSEYQKDFKEILNEVYETNR